VCPINESDCLIMQSKLEGRYPQRLNIIGETNSKQVDGKLKSTLVRGSKELEIKWRERLLFT